MFENNKYSKWYNNIINNALSSNRKKNKLIYERHHIIPKCMNGNNSSDNLVYLTYREHFVCHWLLTKMVISDIHKRKLYSAFYFMTTKSKHNFCRNVNSKLYEIAKKYKSLASRGVKYSKERKEKQRMYAKLAWDNSPERKKELSKRTKMRMINVPKSDITKQKISKSLSGKKHSSERNKNKSLKSKKTWKLTKNTGEIIVTKDLIEYCNVNNYNRCSISNLKHGRISAHKDIIYAQII